jgi:hypothetical protein
VAALQQEGCCRFIDATTRQIDGFVTPAGLKLFPMADILVVLGIVALTLSMLGLIWALERV